MRAKPEEAYNLGHSFIPTFLISNVIALLFRWLLADLPMKH